MAVAVGVAADETSFTMLPETVVVFADDGYYWFLHPLLMDLAQQTGGYIDLYGDASFSGTALEALGETVERARSLVEGQPPSWEVHVGTQTAPVRKELYATVERGAFLR